eukprot:Gb_30983 [translate_table: standard]
MIQRVKAIVMSVGMLKEGKQLGTMLRNFLRMLVLVVKASMVANSKMKMFISVTRVLVFYQWPMLVETPTVLSSSLLSQLRHILMGSSRIKEHNFYVVECGTVWRESCGG